MKVHIPENRNRRQRIYKLKKPEFPCFCCGICCSKFQPRLSLSEARILAHNLGISWERFLAEYIDPHWPGSRSYLLGKVDGACIFLSSGESKKPKLCLIQDFKPTCCAEWKQGINRSECLEGLKTDWDLTVDSSGKICGSQEKIQAFERFISVLNTLSK